MYINTSCTLNFNYKWLYFHTKLFYLYNKVVFPDQQTHKRFQSHKSAKTGMAVPENTGQHSVWCIFIWLKTESGLVQPHLVLNNVHLPADKLNTSVVEIKSNYETVAKGVINSSLHTRWPQNLHNDTKAYL